MVYMYNVYMNLSYTYNIFHILVYANKTGDRLIGHRWKNILLIMYICIHNIHLLYLLYYTAAAVEHNTFFILQN